MADAMTTAEEKKPTLQEQFQTREKQSQAGINKAYDSAINAQRQGLLDAFNANTQAQTNAGQAIRQQRDVLNNDLNVQNTRNTNNINQFADVRDVNRQPGSQATLQLNNARAVSAGRFANAAQNALIENQRQAELAKTNYQNQVAAALADNDYKRAAALFDDYNNQNTWREQQAQVLASYGNFEPYKQLYGDDTANNMRQIWLRQNPDTAYKLGDMDPYTYYGITGRWPAGFNPYSGGGGGGWYDPSSGESKQTESLYGLANASAGRPLMPLNWNVYHTAYNTQTPSLYGVNNSSAKRG